MEDLKKRKYESMVDTQKSRLKVALVTIAALVLVICFALLLASNIDKERTFAHDYSSSIDISELARETVFGSEGFVECLSEHGLPLRDSADLSNWFIDELFDTNLIKTCVMNDDESLFYFEFNESASDIKSLIQGQLTDHDWILVEEDDVLTCVKNQGKCRWMMLSYQGGEDLSAVLHIQHI